MKNQRDGGIIAKITAEAGIHPGGVEFSHEQVSRYARNITVSEIGAMGQRKLLSARVLVVGAGGLGSPALLYLAAAGIGTLAVADADVVELSNLNRQIIHATADLGAKKVLSAAAKIRALNPETRVITFDRTLTSDDAARRAAEFDIVIDATDGFSSKYMLNDACVAARRPLVHGSVAAFEGQMMTIIPGQTACYRCAYPAAPDHGAVLLPSQTGVLGSIAGAVGTLQATEAVKWLVGAGSLLVNRLLLFDGLEMRFQTLKIARSPTCPTCAGAFVEGRTESERPS